jgi:23S rRNA (adenine2503-C2)-methyltransferase
VRERAVHDKQINLDQDDDVDSLDDEIEEQDYQAEHPVQWLKRLDD